MIGFYGSYNDQFITSLGFLTHNPACVPLPEPEPEPEPVEEELEVSEEPIKVEDDDGGADAGMIVGIVLSLIVLIAIGVAGFYIWRKRRNNRDTGQVGNVKLS